MKLATYKDGSRDGQLVVVSRDLHRAHFATGIATRLQQALDDWNFIAPQLQDLSVTLNQGKARHAFAFEPRQCMAPLPRAYQWLSGGAYPAAAAVSAETSSCTATSSPGTPTPRQAPRLQQGPSDDFLGPCGDVWLGSAQWDIDFEAQLAVATGDLAMGANAAQGLDSVRLLLLANGWRLRALAAGEDAAGALHSQPAPAFAPVAVTPDELGEAWQGGRLRLDLRCARNGQRIGQCDAASDMAFHFGELLAHASKTRNLRAGSLVGTGPVQNADPSRGHSSLALRRAHEVASSGSAQTPWLALGESVHIEAIGRDGLSVFGAMAQRVVGPGWAEGAEPGDQPGD